MATCRTLTLERVAFLDKVPAPLRPCWRRRPP